MLSLTATSRENYDLAALDGKFLRSLPFPFISPVPFVRIVPGPVHFPVPVLPIAPGTVHLPVPFLPIAPGPVHFPALSGTFVSHGTGTNRKCPGTVGKGLTNFDTPQLGDT